MTFALELQGVSKSYGASPVLHELQLTVREGEFICLLGPSGCGKTTLLRIIAGLLQPTTGDIRICGREVTAMTPSERNIAMVFQSYALYPHKTVKENIAFPLRMRAPREARIPLVRRFFGAARQIEREIDQKVTATAATLGLEKLLLRKPFELSGGQKQRVALARALVRDPSLFLMDEPLSNLDAKLRTETRREIVELHARTQKTFVYVTHDQVEAMTMAHRIVLLYDGRVQQIGAPLELYDDPQNLFTATFIGTPAINTLSLEVRMLGSTAIPLLEGAMWSAPSAELLAGALGPGRYTIALRPEAVRPGSAEPGADTLAVRPEYCEEMGSETLLWCRAAQTDKAFCARLPRMSGADLMSVQALEFDWQRLLVFDEEGRRVRLEAAPYESGRFFFKRSGAPSLVTGSRASA